MILVLDNLVHLDYCQMVVVLDHVLVLVNKLDFHLLDLVQVVQHYFQDYYQLNEVIVDDMDYDEDCVENVIHVDHVHVNVPYVEHIVDTYWVDDSMDVNMVEDKVDDKLVVDHNHMMDEVVLVLVVHFVLVLGYLVVVVVDIVEDNHLVHLVSLVVVHVVHLDLVQVAFVVDYLDEVALIDDLTSFLVMDLDEDYAVALVELVIKLEELEEHLVHLKLK